MTHCLSCNAQILVHPLVHRQNPNHTRWRKIILQFIIAEVNSCPFQSLTVRRRACCESGSGIGQTAFQFWRQNLWRNLWRNLWQNRWRNWWFVLGVVCFCLASTSHFFFFPVDSSSDKSSQGSLSVPPVCLVLVLLLLVVLLFLPWVAISCN